MTPELAASLYSFDLVQKRAKRPAGAPDKALARPVTKVGIVGAGLMASQLALLFVRRLGVPVVLTDLDQERVDKGVGYVHAEVDKLLAKGRVSADKANRLKALVTGTVDKSTSFADADFVIEAVFEEMKVKKQVFADVEAVVSPECVLATNTSSLSITEMAADLEHPERVVGFHFFNPVAVMPLLEIVKGEQTDDATLATAFATGKALKKTSILVKDSPSFIVNRLLGRFMGEVGRIVDEGTPLEVADGAFAGVAPMPPFFLLSLVGPAIALHNNETLHGAFPDRFYVSPNLQALVAAKKSSVYLPGLLGRPGGRRDLPAPGGRYGAERVRRTRADAGGARRRGAADARRGRRRGPGGPGPGDDHRRGLLVLERRAHPAPRPRGHLGEGQRQDVPLTARRRPPSRRRDGGRRAVGGQRLSRVAPASDTAKTVRNTVVRAAPHQRGLADHEHHERGDRGGEGPPADQAAPATDRRRRAAGRGRGRGSPTTMKPLRPHMVAIMWSSTCFTPSSP